MNKTYTEIRGEELKEILTFIKEQRDNFSSMRIEELPDSGEWSTEHTRSNLRISLKIERNLKYKTIDE